MSVYMMKYALVGALIACAAGPALAQDYPEPGTVLRYDETSIAYFRVPAPTAYVIEVLDSDGSDVVLRSCRPGSCQTVLFRDFIKYAATYYGGNPGDGPGTVDTVAGAAEAITVDITEETGGPFFPLAAGKTLTWTEAWAGAGFAATYRMSITQDCCVPPPLDLGVAGAEEVWTFVYRFERIDEGGDVQEGDFRILYDPELKWIVSQESHNRFSSGDGGLHHNVVRQILKGVETPGDG